MGSELMGNDSFSFGAHLKSVRQEAGISIEEISKELRLATRVLKHIESENLDELPPEVFTKGFLRGYAKKVGASDNEIIQNYESKLASHKKKKKLQANLKNYKAGFKSRLILLFTGVLFIIGLSVFSSSYFQGKNSNNLQAKQEQPKKINTKTDEKEEPYIIQTPVRNKMLGPGSNRSTEKLLLKISAISKIWIKIIIDNQKIKKYTFNPGDSLQLEAASSFNILISDAQGLQLVLNNKPVKIFGKKGRVVSIQIP